MVDMAVKIFLDKSSGLKQPNIDEINNLAFNLYRYFEQSTIQNYKEKTKLKSDVRDVSPSVSRLVYRSYGDVYNASFVLDIKTKNEIKLFSVEGLKSISSITSSDSNDEMSYEAPGVFSVKNESLYFTPNRTDLKDISSRYYVFTTGVLSNVQ